MIPELSRTAIKRLIQQGMISIPGHGTELKPKMKVQTGQQVVVQLPEPEPAEPKAQQIPLEVLFEDSHIIVVNKPPGLTVHPGSGQPDGTLVNALLYHCRDLSGIGGVLRPGIIHRLDKDTSGVMVAAKNDLAHQELSAQFKERRVKKFYLAVCRGIPADASGMVDEPIGRDPFTRIKMAVSHASGRPARTIWRVRRPLFGAALVEAELLTGRTHQIRVHMSHIGHPLLGDTLYKGPRQIKGPGGDVITIERQMLHSWRLSFTHPRSGEELWFEAPMPEDMKHVVEGLS